MEQVRSYIDVIESRLSAQMPEFRDDLTRRATKAALDAQRRGLGDEYALALHVLARVENMALMAKRVARTLKEPEPSSDEKPRELSSALKRLVRSYFGSNDRFLDIDSFAARSGRVSPDFVDAQHAELRTQRNRIVRDLDSRIDAIVYVLQKSRTVGTSLPLRARRELGKDMTKRRHAAWQKEYRRLKKAYRTEKDTWIAGEIAKLSVADGRSAETIRRHMKG